VSYTIPAGVGFNVGVDFYRASADMPLDFESQRGGYTFGFVPPVPGCPQSFMRPERAANSRGVYVHVQTRFLTGDIAP